MMHEWHPGVTLEALEKWAIQSALSFYKGNKTTTSIALGCSIRTLDHRLEKYALEDEGHAKAERERIAARANQMQRARGFHPAQFDTTAGPTPPYNGGGKSSSQASLQNTGNIQETSDSIKEGVRMEPPAHLTAQSAMPVSQRQEVQAVSSQPTSTHRSGKRR